MDRFLDFVRSRVLDGVQIGSSKADVLAAFGPPHDTSLTRPAIWKYQSTEVAFRDGRVMMIAMIVQAHVDVVTNLLDVVGVSYEPRADLTYDDQVALAVVGSGITLTFDRGRSTVRAFAA